MAGWGPPLQDLAKAPEGDPHPTKCARLHLTGCLSVYRHPWIPVHTVEGGDLKTEHAIHPHKIQ